MGSLYREWNFAFDVGEQVSGPRMIYFEPTTKPMPRPQPSGLESPDDMVLPFIEQILMEEDIDERLASQLSDHPKLLAAEKLFRDTLNADSPEGSSSALATTTSKGSSSVTTVSSTGSFSLVGPYAETATADDAAPSLWFGHLQNYQMLEFTTPAPAKAAPYGGSGEAAMLGLAFMRGVEETRKLLPGGDKIALVADHYSAVNGYPEAPVPRDEEENDNASSRRRKPDFDENAAELEVSAARSSKQPFVGVASDDDETDPICEMFERFGLQERTVTDDYDSRFVVMRDELIGGDVNPKEQRKPGGRRRRGRRQPAEVVDVRALLVHCAQAVAANDRRTAGALLKRINEHASPNGDATQRLAHCFAEALQARLAGDGGDSFRALTAQQPSVAHMLKAFQLYIVSFPYKRMSIFFSNQTILDAIAGASRVHIVDYGIQYGLQWPCFLRFLRDRPGGPPRLRLTGIDNPLPGFHPAKLIEETGRRLGRFASDFGVPFEYHGIAAKWETIGLEDLALDPGEALVVNALFRFKSLMDDSVVVDSPRDRVLTTISKLKPRIFVHGVVNGAYGVPFFVTRFREALFHYSGMFDTLEATVPRDNPQRLHIETGMFRRCVLNVVACEGTERVERPETYKQWHSRNVRAGLRQLPLLKAIVDKIHQKVSGFYHRDFVVDEDQGWLLQGWKGRIVNALSAWVAADASVAPALQGSLNT